MPHYLPDLVKYLSDQPKTPETQTPREPLGDTPLSEEQIYQLHLPFEAPVNLEVRIAPKRADTIHFAVQVKGKAG